jgi:hypothetical protein
MEESQLEDFGTRGLLPPKVVAHWRTPLVQHDELHPEDDEIMSFLALHDHGLNRIHNYLYARIKFHTYSE